MQRFVEMALGCVHREYPNHVSLRLSRDEDAKPPRRLTPVFYGCFDWHSAVHGHWVLARGSQHDAPYAARCREKLERSLRPEAVAVEVEYVRRRPGFERPYGLAWLLALQASLEGELAEILRPLADVAVRHLSAWLPKLTHPVRSGTHSQTAFGMGLALDYARAAGDEDFASLLEQRARDFYGADRDYPLHLEPSGEDFLSPSLGAADLMSRVLSPEELRVWLARTMPEVALSPVSVSDPSDGRLAHLDGLNLSRAWMLERVGRAVGDDRLRELAREHGEHAMRAIDGGHYMGTHWLGTFAVYWLELVGSSAGSVA